MSEDRPAYHLSPGLPVYLQTYVVQAEQRIRNGRDGYDIYMPNGRVEWMPATEFAIHHRTLDRRELMLLDQTVTEAQVAAVSDRTTPSLE